MKITGANPSAPADWAGGRAGAARRAAPGALLAGAALLLCWGIASLLRTGIDYPIIRALDAWAGAAPALDRALAWITTYYLFSGVLFLALVWACWFARADGAARGRLLIGTLAACLSAMVGRLLQLTLPSHPRPLHDAAIGVALPHAVDASALNHWNSFPSDHAAVQFGLACAIYRAWPALGRLAFAWAVLLNGARIYLGVHFPSDILGGAALGLCFVLAAEGEAGRRAGCLLQDWAGRAPAAFYGLAFVLSYQIATLFDEARTAAAATLALLRGH